MRRRLAYLALAAELAVFSSGCSLFRRKPKTPPPAPPPFSAPAPEVEPAPLPEPLPEPPCQAPPAELPPGPPAPIATPAPKSAPPPPRNRRRAPVVPKPKAAPAPAPVEAPPPAPAAPAPRLGEVLDEKRRAELNAQLDTNLAETRRILGSLSGRTLDPEQSQAATRAHAFLDQALSQRNSDLITAVELSRRALLLAQSLK